MTFPKRDSYAIYGGDLIDRKPSKNFHQLNATDLPAEDFNQCRSTIAAATQTDFKLYLKVDSDGMGGVKIVEYEAAWDKERTADIIPQIFAPGFLRITIFPIIIDFRGNKQILNLIACFGNPDVQNIAVYQVNAAKIKPTIFDIYTTSGGILTTVLPVDLFFV